jgi:hypothetical protein
LKWITASELNNQGFEVHRKAIVNKNTEDNPLENQSAWEMLGFVQGMGTTTEPHTYLFTDNKIQPGYYTYLLKQIDFDGTFKYSNEINVEVALPLSFILYQNYPNPFNPSTTISWQSPIGGWQTIKLFDVLGREIETIVEGYFDAGSHSTMYIVNSSLPSGVYFYQLKADKYLETKKMILLK